MFWCNKKKVWVPLENEKQTIWQQPQRDVAILHLHTDDEHNPSGTRNPWYDFNDEGTFPNREFSFVLPGDVYVRYQSFANEEEFGKELKRRRPEKIDIGAVYNMKPKLRDTSGDFQPVQKEFVLDIDLTDYDDIRTCCEGAKVCPKCWKFIGVAVEILDAALRDDFGFKHLLWVFSGRRGVHCWVCDEIARFLDISGRSAIIEYLSVIRGGENQVKKVILPKDHMHPFIERALNIIDEYFDIICIEEQGIFEKSQDKNLEVLPEDLKPKIKAENGTRNRWTAIDSWVKEKKADKKVPLWNKPRIQEEIKLQFCYPRLDVNVSKGLNHLLKSPFCIHPKTGRICVPFDPKKVFDFNISNVPTLTSVIDEINAHDAKNANATNINDWKKTSLAPYMDIFSAFVKGLERNNLRKKENLTEETSMDF